MTRPRLTTALTACTERQPYICGQMGLRFYRQKGMGRVSWCAGIWVENIT